MSQEKYQPTPEEIEKAEVSMTDEQKLQSEARNEGYQAGLGDASKAEAEKEKFEERLENGD